MDLGGDLSPDRQERVLIIQLGLGPIVGETGDTVTLFGGTCVGVSLAVAKHVPTRGRWPEDVKLSSPTATRVSLSFLVVLMT